MVARSLRPVAIVGGIRTPFCRSYTGYADLSNQDMLTTVLKGLVDKFDLKDTHIDEVVGGAVVTHSKDWNLAREAVVGSGLAQSTPGITMQQACGTSLQAALMSAGKIASGQIESAIACGADTISDAPIVFGRRFAQRLVKLSRAKSVKQKARLLKGFSFGELAPIPPSTAEARTGLAMGQHCELMAQEWGITRADQDQLAFESQTKAAAAYDEGFFDDLLVSCAGVMRDNNIRDDISIEKMAGMRQAFDRGPKGTLTAANSTPLTDGASGVLLASVEWAEERGLPILAYLSDGQTSAIDFTAGDGLLMAPTVAVGKLLQRQSRALQDFDFYEIHEAFAAQVLCTLTAWEDDKYCQKYLGSDSALGPIDRSKMNVKGSSLAVGHPFAATGGRIAATLAKLLDQKGSGRGLISICTAGGMGVAAILER